MQDDCAATLPLAGLSENKYLVVQAFTRSEECHVSSCLSLVARLFPRYPGAGEGLDDQVLVFTQSRKR